MNILIVGLGNPGYENTYHNAGSDLLLKWALNIPNIVCISKNLFKAKYQNINLYILVCPSTMNISGENTNKIYKYYKCEKLIVVVDDLDTKDIKIELLPRAKGHNGIRSIQKYFTNFTRILIGIGRHNTMSVSDYVLSKRTLDYNIKLYSNILLSFHDILIQYLNNLN